MVYQHLDIGSAKSTVEELAKCPHDLIDLVPPEHAFDAGQFVTHAEILIQSAWDHGQVPCLVGRDNHVFKVVTRWSGYNASG